MSTPQQTTPQASPATDWFAVLAAALCGVAVATNVGKVPISMAQLRQEFGLSLVNASWVSSMFNTLAVFSALMFGMLGDRVGALRMCYMGLAVSVLGGIAGMMSATPLFLLASRFFEGAGFIATAVSAPALLSAAAHASDRRFALGIWATYTPAGVGLATLAAPVLLPLEGWRGLWLFSIVMLLLAAVGITLHRKAYGHHTHGGSTAPFLATAKDALAQPMPWLLAFIFGTWTVQHFALIIWLPTFLKEQRDFSSLTIALLSCLMVLVNVPGNLLGGALLQRNFRRGNLVATASVITGLSSLGIFIDGLPDLVRYGLCLLLSFTGGLIPASVLSSSAALAKSPRQIGTLQGLYMQGAQLGQFFGPPAIAALVASSGHWQSAAWITGLAALGGVTLGLAVRALEIKRVAITH